MPLTVSNMALSLKAALTNALALGTSTGPLDYKKEFGWSSGTGANQADKIYHGQQTVAASGTNSLDLAGGSLTDPLGAALTFAKIKAMVVYASPNNANNVNVIRPAANGVPLFLAAGDGIPVLPGGLFWWVAPNAAGVAVTAGTGDLIDLVNSAGGTPVTADVVIIGTSA